MLKNSGGKAFSVGFGKKGYEDGKLLVVKQKQFDGKKAYPTEVSYRLTPAAYTQDPTIREGAAEQTVSRDNPGATALEQTVIRWAIDSDPQGAHVFYRVLSSIPAVVKNTNETHPMTTPYEETRSFNILGLTYENSRDVRIEIKVVKRATKRRSSVSMYARPSTNRRSAAISCLYPRSNPAGPENESACRNQRGRPIPFSRPSPFRHGRDSGSPTIGRPAKPFPNAQSARPFPPQSSGTEARHRLFSACGAPAPADRRCRENRPRPSACPTSPPAPCRTLARPRSGPGQPNFPGLSALPASPGQQENENGPPATGSPFFDTARGRSHALRSEILRPELRHSEPAKGTGLKASEENRSGGAGRPGKSWPAPRDAPYFA